MTQPSAKIIKDSISQWGIRLTTMEVTMHRFILAEMNTHRAFSRNSASSRAIPVQKIIDRVTGDPAFPVVWPKEQAGMQGGKEHDEEALNYIQNLWNGAKRFALVTARDLVGVKLHKSLTNRLLEPFMWHTAIITATEWDNFFWQRCDPMAQPEMKAVADQMQLAYYTSKPHILTHGEWHMPYVDNSDWEQLQGYTIPLSHMSQIDMLKKVSVARCARVSYLTHDGKRDIYKDVELFDKLLTSGHWSPFEHVAKPVDPEAEQLISNFVGWEQYRKSFKDENRTKFLPNLPELEAQRAMIEAGVDPWHGIV